MQAVRLLVFSLCVAVALAQQQLLDANLVDAQGTPLIVTTMHVKGELVWAMVPCVVRSLVHSSADVIESPNCLDLQRFRALVDQITDQTNCRSGVALVAPIVSTATVDASACPYPFLLRGALASLYAVAATATTTQQQQQQPLRVVRALTPFLFQYGAFRRGYLRICGTVDAAPYVASTAFELGATVQVADGDVWAPAFASSASWTRVAPDIFTYTGPDTMNFARRSIETFQLMWSDAYAWDAIAVTGVFDTATQARAERAPIGGMREARLCASTPSSSSLTPSGALALVIAVPLVVAALALALYVWLMTRLYASRTPLDPSRGAGADDKNDVVKPPPEDQPLFDSVEDTSALSAYAESSSAHDGDGDETNDATSGIWEDEK